jgi:hypothetical protein
LRLHKTRQTRHKRIGQFARHLAQAIFVRPLLGLRTRLRRGGDLAVECLPDISREPAVQQVRRLAQVAEFATAQAAFEQGVASPEADTTTAEKSKSAMASAAAA